MDGTSVLIPPGIINHKGNRGCSHLSNPLTRSYFCLLVLSLCANPTEFKRMKFLIQNPQTCLKHSGKRVGSVVLRAVWVKHPGVHAVSVCLFIFHKILVLRFLKRHGANVALFSSLHSLWEHKFCQQSS